MFNIINFMIIIRFRRIYRFFDKYRFDIIDDYNQGQDIENISKKLYKKWKEETGWDSHFIQLKIFKHWIKKQRMFL